MANFRYQPNGQIWTDDFVGPMPPPAPWQRLDYTLKGPGFDAQYLSDGSVMTEFSNGDPRYGVPLHPTVYPGILPWEMQTLANVVRYGYDPLQESVFQRAAEAASERIANGLSPFWTPQDGASGIQWELLRR